MVDHVSKNQLMQSVDVVKLSLTNIKGDSIDLTKIFLSINIFESIFNYFLHGNIIIMDSFDIQKNFPIVGNEKLEIQLKTNDSLETKTLHFKIFKISGDVELTKNTVVNRKMMSLSFCSAEQLINERTRNSQKYFDNSEIIIGNILSDILESEKPYEYDVSKEPITVFSNYWKAEKIIDFVSRTSKTQDYNDYVFYETLNGFNFKSISNLVDSNPTKEFKFSEGLQSLIETNNMKIFKVENNFDIIDSSRFGVFGSTIYQPHVTDYTYTKTESTLRDAEDTISSTGNNTFFDNELHSISNNVTVNHYDVDVSVSRQSAIELLDNYKLVVRLAGDFDRTIGDMIKITNNKGTVDLDNYDEKYLIGKIKHVIYQNNGFEQNVMLLKNSFTNNKYTDNI